MWHIMLEREQELRAVADDITRAVPAYRGLAVKDSNRIRGSVGTWIHA